MLNPRKKGDKYENAKAEEYGRKQPLSGASWAAKEDIKGEGKYSQILFQTKNAAGQKTYGIKLSDLQDLKRNASKVGRTGLFLINFGEANEYIVMRKKDFDHWFGEADIES